MKRLLTMLAVLLCTSKLLAQPEMSASIQNMHLWRGGEVADGFVLTSDVGFSADNGRLKVGFWGGINGVGEYKEFDYYIKYSAGKLQMILFDTYNFSTYASYNNEEFFNYSPAETGRFLDATIRYSIGQKHPLLLSWSTVLFGRDRDATNSSNRYSTFCSAEYPIYKRERWQIDTGIGAAFALKNIDNSANFYGERAGIVELTLKVSNTLKIANYQIPIYMLAMWNPQSDKAYLQLCAQIFSF
ncbi:MAG: hypothetical protein SNH88_06405 [Rikenellaceae bacterium]